MGVHLVCESPSAAFWNCLRRAAILAEYPFLDPEDFQQALRYAATAIDDERRSTDRVA